MRTSVKILGKLVIIITLFIVLSTCIAGAKATAAPTQQPMVGYGIGVSASQVSSVSQQICGYTPVAGYKFVAFYCTVHDVADSGLMVSPDDWQLRDTAGGVYMPATPTFCPNINGFPPVGNLQPGDIISGYIVYSVPQNAHLKSITYNGPSNSVIISL